MCSHCSRASGKHLMIKPSPWKPNGRTPRKGDTQAEQGARRGEWRHGRDLKQPRKQKCSILNEIRGSERSTQIKTICIDGACFTKAGAEGVGALTWSTTLKKEVPSGVKNHKGEFFSSSRYSSSLSLRICLERVLSWVERKRQHLCGALTRL